MKPPPIVVLYVPALDRRRLTPAVTPFLCRILAEHPVIELETHPSVELLPSLVTGVWPHQHRLWQVRIRPEMRSPPATKWIDRLPARWTTFSQCLRHRFDPDFDLPTIEPQRRRQYEIHRLKMLRRQGGGLHQVELACPTLFSALPGTSRHRTYFTFAEAKAHLIDSLDPACRLDLLEFYALDLFSHWNLDRPEAMREKLGLTDRLLQETVQRARRLGLRVLLVVDHGQEPVRHTVNLPHLLATSGVPARDFNYFIEVTNARFWFFTEQARAVLPPLLRGVSDATYLAHHEMANYHIHFAEEEGFGDAYLIAKPGTVFFPHDFYHPLVNRYMARATPEQRVRSISPVHRGAHGYLPGPPADTGYLVALDSALRPARPKGLLIDVAPTLLTLLGVNAPATMTGSSLYEHGP